MLPSAGFSLHLGLRSRQLAGQRHLRHRPRARCRQPGQHTLNGVPIDLGASYRVTVNNFMADGGDGFFVLRQGTNRVGGLEDLQAFEAYLHAAEPGGISPPPLTRITRVN